MILTKQVAVYLNLVHNRFKQYVFCYLKQNDLDITPEQFLLIDTLWNKGTMSQQKIADSIYKDKNSVTKLVDALEKKGLVVRIADDTDRRQNLIALTQKAEKMKDEAKEVGINCVQSVTEGIPDEDIITFLSVLKRMSENIDDNTETFNLSVANGETI